MAITLERPAFYENKRCAEYCGLSTDNKADIKANNADEFYEIDTGAVYKYAEGSGWIKQANQVDGKVDKPDIVQKTGQSTTSVMSQKSTTDEIDALKNDITDLQTALIGVSDLIGGDA